MGWRILAAAAVGFLTAADKPEEKGAVDPKLPQGTWALVSMEDTETGRIIPIGEQAGYFQLRFEGNVVSVHEGGTRISGGQLDGQAQRITWMHDRGQVSFALAGNVLTIYQSGERDSIVPFFTSFGDYSRLTFQRETADTPHVVAIDKECKELEGTWRLLYRLPESEMAEQEGNGRHQPVLKLSSIDDLRKPADQCRRAPPHLLFVFKGRKVLWREEGDNGEEQVDLWVNPRIAPKRMEMGAMGMEYGGTYELKGDLLRVRRAGGDQSEEAIVDLWQRQR